MPKLTIDMRYIEQRSAFLNAASGKDVVTLCELSNAGAKGPDTVQRLFKTSMDTGEIKFVPGGVAITDEGRISLSGLDYLRNLSPHAI